nr:trypsin-like peptidase domain-containing protein [Lederbergia citri]
MYCTKCGASLEQKSKYCSECGKKVNGKNKVWVPLIALTALLCIGVFYFLSLELNKNRQEIRIEQVKKEDSESASTQLVEVKTQETSPPPKEVSKIIEEAQPKVFTIFNDFGQGSGFLINRNGDILTNAHVVEGSVNVLIRNYEGREFDGKVIGYSNEIDIAVIRVDHLAGRTPLELEEGNGTKLGDEVIALGSPRGFENTATLGNISGINRSFVIPPHTYDGIYQISAPIAPGSSGGPLIDKKTEKVIAINSARDNRETNIAFSIPIIQVIDIINGWVSSPMSFEEIAALFNNDAGQLFYQDLFGNDYYFDGGEYSDEYEDYHQYEFPYWGEYGDSYEDEYDWDYTDDYIDDEYQDDDDYYDYEDYEDDDYDYYDDESYEDEYYYDDDENYNDDF